MIILLFKSPFMLFFMASLLEVRLSLKFLMEQLNGYDYKQFSFFFLLVWFIVAVRVLLDYLMFFINNKRLSYTYSFHVITVELINNNNIAMVSLFPK